MADVKTEISYPNGRCTHCRCRKKVGITISFGVVTQGKDGGVLWINIVIQENQNGDAETGSTYNSDCEQDRDVIPAAIPMF